MGDMAPNIRRATAADIPAVIALLETVWHETYDGIYGVERVDEILSSWSQLWADEAISTRPNFCRLVAEDVDQQLVATSSATRDEDGWLKLHQLYIQPQQQGQGLGRRLLGVTSAEFNNVVGVRLEVEPENANAIAFYTRNGFVRAGEIADCGREGSGIRALLFERHLI